MKPRHGRGAAHLAGLTLVALASTGAGCSAPAAHTHVQADDVALLDRCEAALRSYTADTQVERAGPTVDSPSTRLLRVRRSDDLELSFELTVHEDASSARAHLEESSRAVPVAPDVDPPELGDLARRWSSPGGSGTLLTVQGRLFVHASGNDLAAAEQYAGHLFLVIRGP